MKVKKGDKVKILSGKDRGKTGSVVSVLRKSGRLIVEGVNIVTRFEKKNNEKKTGGITKGEAPIYTSKVQVLDDEGKATRIGFEIKEGKKIRISKKTKKAIS